MNFVACFDLKVLEAPMSELNLDNQKGQMGASADGASSISSDSVDVPHVEPEQSVFLGLTRHQRIKIYAWSALFVFVAGVVWSLIYLRPDRWYKYTDQVAFEQVAQDVELGFVLWDQASRVDNVLDTESIVAEPAISSDGARMVYSTGQKDGNANLFVRRWDGNRWGTPTPMRALNSAFHEISPAFNGDASLLFFSTDRPGGSGGYDIWVSRWDGAEYAWPLPLTGRINTQFDETGPSVSPDGLNLYLASNRPRPVDLRTISEQPKKQNEQDVEGNKESDQSTESGADTDAADVGQVDSDAASVNPVGEKLSVEQVEKRKGDFDIYVADIASKTPYDLIVERQLSMLYSLREGALADIEVMEKLGGSAETESAVDKALAYLAKTQEPDGRWDLGKNGGTKGHDVAATAFALLAFYGRGERHDQSCKYQDQVKRGIAWLTDQQNAATGDLRGYKPASNAMYDHGIAALAVVEAYGVTKDPQLRSKAVAAIEFISDSQHEEGGWRYKPGDKGDLSVTGWMIMALASAQMSGVPVPQETIDGASEFLKYVSGGKFGGSYGYTDSPGKGPSNRNAMNAVGFFCAQLTGHSANSTKAFESAAILNKAGVKLEDLYYIYYGTLATYQHQGPIWRNWRDGMQAQLVKTQGADGAWIVKGGHSGAMGSVIGTALVALCLEAHYRYTPLYGLGFEPDPQGPSPDVIEQDALPQIPLFRHAKFVEVLSSPSDDTSPVSTDHGDFLYFVSDREGGMGGKDLYRSRIGPKGFAVPKNMGAEINSIADETDPAVKMAGFQLIYNSNRESADSDTASGSAASRLYSAKSRRVVRRYDYSKMPTGNWFESNLELILGFSLTLILFLWMTIRALKQGRRHRLAMQEYAQANVSDATPTGTAN
jgi:hypothetical protein